MRARMALKYADITVEIREIELRNKPAHMLQVSPKATVPVLISNVGKVIEQSLDIMLWALQKQDNDGWLNADSALTQQIIVENDSGFKQALDKYKYAIRFPEQSAQVYRAQGEVFLKKLESLLSQSRFLLGNQIILADIAIFPFIRQFSGVDSIWYESAPYPRLKACLNTLIESEWFISIMQKQPAYMT